MLSILLGLVQNKGKQIKKMHRKCNSFFTTSARARVVLSDLNGKDLSFVLRPQIAKFYIYFRNTNFLSFRFILKDKNSQVFHSFIDNEIAKFFQYSKSESFLRFSFILRAKIVLRMRNFTYLSLGTSGSLLGSFSGPS